MGHGLHRERQPNGNW